MGKIIRRAANIVKRDIVIIIITIHARRTESSYANQYKARYGKQKVVVNPFHKFGKYHYNDKTKNGIIKSIAQQVVYG